jgi:predicted lipoprotein with Yx(FWY)xxD motif
MFRILATAAVAASLILAACGDDDDDSGSQNAAPEQASAESAPGEDKPAEKPERSATDEKPGDAKPGTEITVDSSEFGDIIFDGSNQAIYLFDKETSSTPECYGDCAAAWPPVLTDGEPVASGAAQQKLLGTTEREDGSTQVTYAGQPLYYYAHEGPGQVLCHNVAEFGGLWLVLDAGGQALS